MKNSIKRRVKIVDTGRVHDTFTKAFEELGFRNKFNNPLKEAGGIGTVFNTMQYHIYETLLAVDLDSGQQVLINKEGVEFLDHVEDNVCLNILIQELQENTHLEKVEDVIFWALEAYSKKEKPSNGSMVAYSIVNRIRNAEKWGER